MAQHQMVDLKRKRSDDEDVSLLTRADNEDFFPLNLHLSNPEIEKLGLGAMAVGEEHELVAKVRVTSVFINEREGAKKTTSITLTLLAAEVNSEHSDEDRAKKIFTKM